MTALNIDTHKFVRRLREAGFDERQAEALVDGLSEMDTSQLATKADLREAVGDLRTEMWKMQFTTIGATVALVVGLLKLFP